MLSRLFSTHLFRGKGVLPGWCILGLVVLPISSYQQAFSATEGQPATLPGESAMAHAVKHLDPKYVCPMHPQIIKDQPGNCPICGMRLVKREVEVHPSGAGQAQPVSDSSKTSDAHPEVKISGAMIQSMGVRTAQVERGTLSRKIRSVGRVNYDETRLAHVHPRAEGWIEQLSVRAEGDRVHRGQVLGQLYAPVILSAQVDFLIALKQYGNSSPEKVDKARNLLRLLDVPESVINQIAQNGSTRNTIPILAPIEGVITRMGLREGIYVTPGSELVTIADLLHVWVKVDVFEHQLAWLEPGLDAEIRIPAQPGRVWKGKVDYIYPELDPRTRTLQVRLSFENPENLLRPNMFADVVIFGAPREQTLTIPSEALIVTGERQAVVKALDEGRFKPVEVETGMRGSGKVEILSGLREGESVVVSGQFLIDSESSLQASFVRMQDSSMPVEAGDSSNAHAH